MKLKSFISVFFFLLLTVFFVKPHFVNAAALTWDGGGADNNWSTCANWTTDACPGSADTVTFSGTSTKNSTVDASFGGAITSLTIASGYTGTIALARSLTTSTTFNQAAGAFNGDGQTLTVGTSFTLSSGTFTAPSSTLSVAGTFTISGGTFNHNGGTVTSTAAATISCNNAVFNLFTFVNGGTRTVQSNCSLPLGANPTIPATMTLNGTLSGTGTLTFTAGTLTLNSGSSITGFSGLAANVLTISSATYNFGSYTVFSVAGNYSQTGGSVTVPSGADFNSSFTLNSGSVFNAPSGIATFASNFTLNSGSTFNVNGGTVIFDGGNGTLSCNSTTFNLVILASSGGVKTIGNNCSLPLGANPSTGTAGTNGDIVLNGTLTGSGTLTIGPAGSVTDDLTINSTGSLVGFSGYVDNGTTTISGATVNFGSYATVDFNRQFVLSSGAVFTAPSGTMTASHNFTLNSGTTFNANGGTVIFDGAGATLICNNTIFNLVVFNNTATKTVSSDCSLPLGSNPIVGAGIVLSGTLSGSGTLTLNTSLTLNAGAILSGFNGLSVGNVLTISGATVDLGSYTPVNVDGNFAVSSGSFIAPSGTMTIAGNFNHSGGTFTHNNGTVVMDGTLKAINDSTTFYNLTKIGSDTLTIEAGSTQTIIGTLTLKGIDENNKLIIRSLTPGTQWNIDPQGARSISFVDVQDSKNIKAAVIIACNSTDSGNNTAWSFNPASCTPVTPAPTSSGASTTSNSTTSAPSCDKPAPGVTPINLYSALAKGSTSVLLSFGDASDPYDHYVLEYGTKQGEYIYGADNIGGKGTREYLVQGLNPSTKYYFRIRAGNGCAPGPWSNEISAKTRSFLAGYSFIDSTSLKPIDESGESSSTSKRDALGCINYTVKSGDSLWSIARHELGSGAKFDQILSLNEKEYPELDESTTLNIGMKLKVDCKNSKDEDSSSSSVSKDRTYDVSVIVTDEKDKPIGGATVTLHSTPRETTTNEKGIASFKDVEKGEHKVIIAYKDQVGEQKMVLADDVKRYELSVKLQRSNPLFSPQALSIIGVLLTIILFLGYRLSSRPRSGTS